MRRMLASALLGLGTVMLAAAWDNHAQLSYLALGNEAFAQGGGAAAVVKAETLEAFLLAEKAKLPALLARLETEARRDIQDYKALPAELVFNGTEPDASLRLAFLHAIRVNPGVPFPLFVQLQAGTPRDGRPDLAVADVDRFENHLPNGPFKALSPGLPVKALEVVASASDEPDYGMDIGLFSDNKGELASLYGFGVQGFGNPALPYGSQAPFHMAFAHEDPVIKLAAAFTRISLADWRFRLYTELARFSFAEGHAYWGYRFAGWALHYLADMAQPYHASCIPGKSALGILWLYSTGSQAAKDGEMILLSNRHYILEDYAYSALAEFAGDDAASPLFAALRGTGLAPAAPPEIPYRNGYLFDVVSKRAFDRGRAIDSLTVRTFPAAITSDPHVDIGAIGGHSVRDDLIKADPDKAKAYEAALAPVFSDLGSASRAFMAYARDPAAVAAPRKAPADLRGLAYIVGLLIIIGAIISLFVITSGAKRRTRARTF